MTSTPVIVPRRSFELKSIRPRRATDLATENPFFSSDALLLAGSGGTGGISSFSRAIPLPFHCKGLRH